MLDRLWDDRIDGALTLVEHVRDPVKPNLPCSTYSVKKRVRSVFVVCID